MDHEPAEAEASIRELIDFCISGAIKPLISARYPLEKGAEAIASLAERKVLGKAVVMIN
jgi:NADPH2:quinone reductase